MPAVAPQFEGVRGRRISCIAYSTVYLKLLRTDSITLYCIVPNRNFQGLPKRLGGHPRVPQKIFSHRIWFGALEKLYDHQTSRSASTTDLTPRQPDPGKEGSGIPTHQTTHDKQRGGRGIPTHHQPARVEIARVDVVVGVDLMFVAGFMNASPAKEFCQRLAACLSWLCHAALSWTPGLGNCIHHLIKMDQTKICRLVKLLPCRTTVAKLAFATYIQMFFTQM